MNIEMIGGLIRHLLTFGGGILAAKGYGDAETWAVIAGAAATLAGGVWSIFIKRPA